MYKRIFHDRSRLCLRHVQTAADALIKKMDRQHFIERKYIPEDRRIIRIAITDTGRNMLEEIHKYTVQILEEKLSALEEKDRKKLSVSLTSVYEIFSRENIFK